MQSCRPCAAEWPPFLLPCHVQRSNVAPDPPALLMRAAFEPPTGRSRPPLGLAAALHNETTPELVPTAYRQPLPSCLSLAVAHGIRGAVVGSVFGGAMALTTAVSSRYPRDVVLSQTANGAIRNAAGFAAWTSVFALTRCTLVRIRRRDDMLNPLMAGAFTGGVLTLISVRGHWRFYQSQILTNAGASAMIAVVFDSLNRI